MSRPLKADAVELMEAGLRALRRHEPQINALNVFPVPDGDTGTNLVMTVQAVSDQLEQASPESMGDLTKAITLGSLMGARGNSGVILSQIIRGICETIAAAEEIGPSTVASALENAVKIAYQAIRKPVEGTMLTVIRDAARAASAAVVQGEAEAGAVLDIALHEASESVERTPDLLPVLKEAGVVDAGGYGLVVLGQGIVGMLLGRPELAEELVPAPGIATGREEVDLTYRYCTEFVVAAEQIDVGEAEGFLSGIGGSVMVAASPGLTRIHVHTNTPGTVIDWASDLGTLDQIKINDMEEQVRERSEALAGVLSEGVGVVAVGNGDGVVAILKSLGVDRVVDGGQTMNPSAADLVHAVESTPFRDVVILPNNGNIILTAQQVEQLTSKQIRVVPTKTIPEGFAAMLEFDRETPLQRNTEQMATAAAKVKTGEITNAVRGGKSGDLRFRKGDLIGIADGDIRVVGHKLASTAARLVEKMLGPEDEALTLIVGGGADRAQVERVVAKLARRHPGLDIDVQQGGQPLYPLIIGVE